jgi:uncharacterized protein YqjF (DUF2071 family)
MPVADTVRNLEDFGPRGQVFLTAEWRYLAILNFEVDPALLAPWIPPGTELDRFDGRAFISLVGFRFLDARVYGISVPFHRNFDEVNLRFYVRRRERDIVKRGVVFVQEIVPRRAVAAIARWAYHENYRRLAMSHQLAHGDNSLRVEYAWRLAGRWNRLALTATGEPCEMVEGSLEQFIAEHYWGYCAPPDGGTIEYRVAHPPWRIWNAVEPEFTGDSEALYGPEFSAVLRQTPDSALLSEGSRVVVYAGNKF